MTGDLLNIAVAGLGFGANHARVLKSIEGVRLAAVCDPTSDRLSAVIQRLEVEGYTDYEEMLERGALDAVVVATPASLHEDMALTALRAGCAVLVEKPLASTLDGGIRIVAEARSRGLPVMPGHIERFNPAIRELARRVQAGDAGRVLQLSARRTSAIRVPPSDVNVVFDSAIHDIDAMRFVLGSDVTEVYAGSQSGIVAPAENGILAQLRFQPLDGVAALGALDISWLSPRRLRDLAVLGDRGLFAADYAAQTLDFYPTPAVRFGPVQGWDASRAGDAEVVHVPIEPREQLSLELEAFVQALRDGCLMPVSTDDGLASLAVAEALTQSARSGRAVRPRGWSIE